MADILVFGDSGSYGAWDMEGGYIQRLRKFLDRKNIPNLPKFLDRGNIVNIPKFTLIYNLSISGDTTEDLIKRFDAEAKTYLKGEKAHMIIFSIGVNDSRKINGKPAVSPEKFRRNIVELIKRAKEHTQIIVFIGLEAIPKFVQWSKSETYRVEDIQKYDNIINSVCKENKVYFIEILKKLMNLNYLELLEDELHFNTKGHQKIFEIVKNFLIENKII